MKHALKTVSVALFAAAALFFAASNIVAGEALASTLMYIAAICGLIAIVCNFLIRPKEKDDDKK